MGKDKDIGDFNKLNLDGDNFVKYPSLVMTYNKPPYLDNYVLRLHSQGVATKIMCKSKEIDEILACIPEDFDKVYSSNNTMVYERQITRGDNKNAK